MKKEALLERLVDFLDLSRTIIRHEIQVHQLQMLLAIAAKPGMIAKEIRERLDITGGMLTRNAKALGTYYTKDENGNEQKHGLGLLYFKPGKFNMKANEYYVTEKGEKVVNEFLQKLSDFVEHVKNSKHLTDLKGG